MYHKKNQHPVLNCPLVHVTNVLPSIVEGLAYVPGMNTNRTFKPGTIFTKRHPCTSRLIKFHCDLPVLHDLLGNFKTFCPTSTSTLSRFRCCKHLKAFQINMYYYIYLLYDRTRKKVRITYQTHSRRGLCEDREVAALHLKIQRRSLMFEPSISMIILKEKHRSLMCSVNFNFILN